MSPEECSLVLKIVDNYHMEKLHGKWGTVRQSSVKTSDVAVEDIIELHSWLLALLHNKLYPLLYLAFPILADGTTLIEDKGVEREKKVNEKDEEEEEEIIEKYEIKEEKGKEEEEEKIGGKEGKKENNHLNNLINKYRVRVHDAFIVRYDAEIEKTFSLPEHCDTSSMSIILSLNEHETEYENENESSIVTYNKMENYVESEFLNENKNKSKNENKNERVRYPCKKEGSYTGGGTWFEALGPKGIVVNADIGHAVLFAGPLRHAGFPIHRGVRNILVLFLYVEGFHYGPYLRGSAPQLSSSTARAAAASSLSSSSSRENEECYEFEKVEMKESCTSCSSFSSSSSPSAAAATPLTVTVTGTVTGIDLGSGSDKNGFVVYRQTVDLVSMLEEEEEEEEEGGGEEEEGGGEEIAINSNRNSHSD